MPYTHHHSRMHTSSSNRHRDQYRSSSNKYRDQDRSSLRKRQRTQITSSQLTEILNKKDFINGGDYRNNLATKIYGFSTIRYTHIIQNFLSLKKC